MAVLTDFDQARHVSLTTYRRDGTAVNTPVWHAVDAGRVYIVSDADAWKVKRIRNNSAVVLTVCDIRGRITPGAPTAEGSAQVLDDAGTVVARRLIARKYLLSRVGNWFARVLHLRKPPVVGIAVTL